MTFSVIIMILLTSFLSTHNPNELICTRDNAVHLSCSFYIKKTNFFSNQAMQVLLYNISTVCTSAPFSSIQKLYINPQVRNGHFMYLFSACFVFMFIMFLSGNITIKQLVRNKILSCQTHPRAIIISNGEQVEKERKKSIIFQQKLLRSKVFERNEVIVYPQLREYFCNYSSF